MLIGVLTPPPPPEKDTTIYINIIYIELNCHVKIKLYYHLIVLSQQSSEQVRLYNKHL